MQFSRLKLVGFKSFVDPTEIYIEPGLTGIVGPNGCGKSNLVEALRWVMGESSAKQMRGGEMDDVIFAGTSARPARNMAEVVLDLDNARRDAPAAYNDASEIEVSRRIDRGAGSTYRINGKDTRARDVHLLFADAASGARSTAIVSQGQIGAVINAKPVQRRHLLEEAAGITGLHNRRHEAELRLAAAETNLERLDDVLAALATQLQGLKRQARQAARYRSLSGRIRKAEAALLYKRWEIAEAEVADMARDRDAAQAVLTERTREAAQASTAQAEAAGAMPPLRDAAAAAGAAVHRLEVARDALDEEEQRVAQATAALEDRLQQIDADREREAVRRKDANETFAKLNAQRDEIVAAQAAEQGALDQAHQALDAARAAVAEVEADVARLTEHAAASDAERQALDRHIAELDSRLRRIDDRLAEIADELAAMAEAGDDSGSLTPAEAELASARAAVAAAGRAQEAAQDALSQAEAARDAAISAERGARAAHDRIQARHTNLTAQADALAAIVDTPDPDSGRDAINPVVDQVRVAAGYEIALGAALGEDLQAATDSAAPAHWRLLPPDAAGPALPDGATPLADFVEAPTALARRVSQIGVVDGADGPRLQSMLAQGQRLISRDGAMWRWDGYTRSADAPGAAAIRLRQVNRLAELRSEIEAVAAELAASVAELDDKVATSAAKTEAYTAARAVEARALGEARAAAQSMDAARDAFAGLVDAAAAARSRRQALNEDAERLQAERRQAETELSEAQARRAALPDPETLRQPLDERRADLAARRDVMDEHTRAHDRLLREAELRSERLAAFAEEAAIWQRQADEAARHIEALAERRQQAETELAALRERPAQIARERDGLLDALTTAEAERGAAADALAVAETELAACDKALAAANEALAEAREENARADGRLDQASAVRDLAAERIGEALECAPAEALSIAEVASPDALADLATLERQLDRLHRERDTMGAVNLRAETEAEELTEQITTIETEREDLIGAIARLRNGIATLNREGRQRLLAAFNEVNGHFETLFTRLFGGGRAHLSLVDDDDPLEAGLEIMASPPGKRLQVLTLLSGGEKALAALALLFAVFLTKPAPICVLDEVDAPLDDANVDRFLSLVADIAASAETRFLIITHHRLSMARMDRLYGVTMGERGVSQLVSVDMGRAQELQAAE